MQFITIHTLEPHRCERNVLALNRSARAPNIQTGIESASNQEHGMNESSMREQLTMDGEALYREESFSDRRTGTIQRLTPVTADGEDDASRQVRYIGQTQVMSPAGALPITFELEVDSLSKAVSQFPEAAEKAVEETVEELKRLQRESQSSIMVPGQEGGGQMGGMGGQGAGPGGGIQI
jgi:hypothetical protein